MGFVNEDIDQFFENAALSLHWVGGDGMILRANQYELDFLGYAREEYEGHHIAEFHVDKDVIADILRRLNANEKLEDYAARLLAKDGSVKHVLINSNVRWEGDTFVHTRCFTRDITEQKMMGEALEQANAELEQRVIDRTAQLAEANERLRQADELKSRFLAMAAHELRTPLTAISGFSSTLLKMGDTLDDEDKQKFLEIIDGQTGRLARIVDDLLTLSKIEGGALTTSLGPVDVSFAIKQTIRELGADSVQVRCPAKLRAIADAGHVQQILVNYISNALKYGAAPIQVHATADEHYVQVCVCDEGPGVPAEFEPLLFERFARAAPAQDEPVEGTGLGLSIVRGLAQAQGGDAWYQRNEPRGSRFCVRLPRVEAEQRA